MCETIYSFTSYRCRMADFDVNSNTHPEVLCAQIFERKECIRIQEFCKFYAEICIDCYQCRSKKARDKFESKGSHEIQRWLRSLADDKCGQPATRCYSNANFGLLFRSHVLAYKLNTTKNYTFFIGCYDFFFWNWHMWSIYITFRLLQQLSLQYAWRIC